MRSAGSAPLITIWISGEYGSRSSQQLSSSRRLLLRFDMFRIGLSVGWLMMERVKVKTGPWNVLSCRWWSFLLHWVIVSCEQQQSRSHWQTQSHQAAGGGGWGWGRYTHSGWKKKSTNCSLPAWHNNIRNDHLSQKPEVGVRWRSRGDFELFQILSRDRVKEIEDRRVVKEVPRYGRHNWIAIPSDWSSSHRGAEGDKKPTIEESQRMPFYN